MVIGMIVTAECAKMKGIGRVLQNFRAKERTLRQGDVGRVFCRDAHICSSLVGGVFDRTTFFSEKFCHLGERFRLLLYLKQKWKKTKQNQNNPPKKPNQTNQTKNNKPKPPKETNKTNYRNFSI